MPIYVYLHCHSFLNHMRVSCRYDVCLSLKILICISKNKDTLLQNCRTVTKITKKIHNLYSDFINYNYFLLVQDIFQDHKFISLPSLLIF